MENYKGINVSLPCEVKTKELQRRKETKKAL